MNKLTNKLFGTQITRIHIALLKFNRKGTLLKRKVSPKRFFPTFYILVLVSSPPMFGNTVYYYFITAIERFTYTRNYPRSYLTAL